MTEPDIRVAELRRALKRVLDAVEERFGADLTFAEDYYWNVPFDRAISLRRRPRLDMESVQDDVESVREFATQSVDEYVSVWHECDHLAGVLRAIARLDVGR